MEEARQKNSEDLAKTVGRMEEAVEKENDLKLKNIFSFIFQNFLEEWKKLSKKIQKTWQKLLEEWKKLWKKKIFQS